jgi:AAA ATPase domain
MATQLLRGRRSECETLDRLLGHVRAGESRALVLRGEPGVGKTALLEYTIESAPDFRVVRAVGVESEMELAFAALQQLCAPMPDRLDRLPGPQRDALAYPIPANADVPDFDGSSWAHQTRRGLSASRASARSASSAFQPP